MSYRRVHLLVEGQTEQEITNTLFRPFLEGCGWSVTASVLITKRSIVGPAHRGGLGSWPQILTEIRRLLQDKSISVLTTVIDYYGLPAESPGMDTRPSAGPRERVEHVEAALGGDVADRRFVPHLSLHESEAWMFAAAEQLGEALGTPQLAVKLRKDVDRAGGAESINDGPRTAPSKRLIAHHPTYNKLLDGPPALVALGLKELRERCPHLDEWLGRFHGG